MKLNTIIKLSFVLILFLATGCGSAEPDNTQKEKDPGNQKPEIKENVTIPDEREKVKESLEKIFEISQGSDFADAASMLLYSGKNKDERWKRTLNYAVEDEKLQTDKMCSRIQVILSGVEKKEYREFVQETESEGTWNIWIVHFIYEDGTDDEKAFAFLKTGTNYALGDID